MMTREELDKACRRSIPVTVELINTFNNGTYPYMFITAFIDRYDPKSKDYVMQVEVTKHNHRMTVSPEQIRLSTPREIIDFGTGGTNNECNV